MQSQNKEKQKEKEVNIYPEISGSVGPHYRAPIG